MGQKVHPGGMRVGVIHDWKSNWYTGNKDFADFLQEDVRIRQHIYNKLAHARAGLGPVRRRRPRGGSGQGRGPRRPREDAPAENVEQPRTDEQGVSAEGREQPAIEPQVEETPAAVADAPDTTTQKQMHEDPTKLDQSGDPSAEKPKTARKPAAKKAPAAKAKPAAKRTTKKDDES